jgi:hypothetical protein
LKDIMVKMDGDSHSILKKYKKRLRNKGIKVPLGAAIREMDKLIKDDCEGVSKKDLKDMRHAVDKLKDIVEKYHKPTFSDAVREMDTIIKAQSVNKAE